jgi:uncharacterized protein (DUF2235 family)
MVHAVSLDENRSKFKPLLLCDPVKPDKTVKHEVWFPGAHSDVGGGYEDSDRGLSDISLKWMVEIFNSSSLDLNLDIDTNPDSDGLAHWPIGDLGGTGSLCEDRVVPDMAVIDDAVDLRRNKSPVNIRWHGEILTKKYPLTCKDDKKQ